MIADKDEHIKTILSVIPEKPGCYQYFDENGTIIYVGKAKNLRQRLSNYFAPLRTLQQAWDETREVGPGEVGELVLTTLTKEGIPMLRYRTRDLTRLLPGTARPMRRMQKITGRSDDMMIIHGINVFPSQIEAALLAVEGALPHYRIVLRREHGLDQMQVEIEVSPEFFSDRIGAMEALRGRIAHSIHNITGLNVAVRLAEPHSLPRSEGKARRVWDERQDSQ